MTRFLLIFRLVLLAFIIVTEPLRERGTDMPVRCAMLAGWCVLGGLWAWRLFEHLRETK